VRLLLLVLAVLAVGAAAGCSESTSSGKEATVEDRPVRVVTTVNFLADMASRIGGDRVEAESLMGPGVDPHLYKASAGDVGTLREADVVLYGGLELEGRMADLLEELSAERRTVAVTEDMPRGQLLRPAEFEGKYDPHVWFDVPLWTDAARRIAAELSDVDPRHAAGYERRLRAYLAELDELDAEVRRLVRDVPERSRVLITSHDAFNYFGRRYGFDVVAIQGISTQTEATTADIERVAGVIADRGVRSVFIESSVPRQTIEAVIAAAREQGQETRLGGELFSDAAGDAGTPEGTYAGMVSHNARTIGEGLR
jgi:manganese/zinc/iron transport system substrate-binding protein